MPRRHGISIRYGARATALLRGPKGIEGVRIFVDGVEEIVHARAVVLACGGFEANREWRARYLGPGWDMAKVRGTTAFAWRWTSAHNPTDSGRGVTLSHGNVTPALRRHR